MCTHAHAHAHGVRRAQEQYFPLFKATFRNDWQSPHNPLFSVLEGSPATVSLAVFRPRPKMAPLTCACGGGTKTPSQLSSVELNETRHGGRGLCLQLILSRQIKTFTGLKNWKNMMTTPKYIKIKTGILQSTELTCTLETSSAFYTSLITKFGVSSSKLNLLSSL